MMSFRVFIIVLLAFSTAAHAARGPRRTPPCERILVSDDMQEAVNETGREIAELKGKYNLILTLRSSPTDKVEVEASDERLEEIGIELEELTSRLARIRAHYTISQQIVIEEHGFLVTRLAQLKPGIESGLRLKTSKPVTQVKERRRFMKREALRGLPEDLLDGDAQAIEDYFRQSDEGVATPPSADQTSPPWYPGLNPRPWPPREKP